VLYDLFCAFSDNSASKTKSSDDRGWWSGPTPTAPLLLTDQSPTDSLESETTNNNNKPISSWWWWSFGGILLLLISAPWYIWLIFISAYLKFEVDIFK
jgi:hypothetical protein